LPMQGSKEEMGMILKIARKIVATIVGDLMSTDPLTIHPNVSMREAAALMASQRMHRLCVVDDDGEMIGMLATSDVMEDVLDAVHQALPETSTAMKQDTDLMP
jgi:CBS domain-containing protein